MFNPLTRHSLNSLEGFGRINSLPSHLKLGFFRPRSRPWVRVMSMLYIKYYIVNNKRVTPGLRCDLRHTLSTVK